MAYIVLISIIGSSLWVYIDALRIGVHKTGDAPKTLRLHVDMEPVDWLISCLLLWAIAFPVYLFKRRGFIKRFCPLRSRSILPPSEPVEYFYEQLRNLSRLKSEGRISDEEFCLRRREVLGL